MTIRPLLHADLRLIPDITDVMTVGEYVHIERLGEGLSLQWKITLRPLREPHQVREFAHTADTGPLAGCLPEEVGFSLRMLATPLSESMAEEPAAASDGPEGTPDGLALVGDYDGRLVAVAAVEVDSSRRVAHLLTLRVDEDFRRQGVGLGLAFRLQHYARNRGLRAVTAATSSSNPVAAHFLIKAGYQLSGIDTVRHSNHDLVKEQATLLWTCPLD